MSRIRLIFSALILFLLFNLIACAQSGENISAADEKVQQFLENNRRSWQDMNVPYQDGQVLYDLIIKNNYTSALEIGTSTGHSTIWIAWAMSKTGGKVTTIEVNKSRHREALENIREADLEKYVDARLADAHKLVKELNGPFDFVFSDADKDWYIQYFKDVSPKLETGGCFTAHNVLNGYGGTQEYLDYVGSLDNYETTIDRSSSSGISISFKKSE
ncbi:MAG: class I SAM-dependent methyltransferase [Cyclobacteriaceae bacterium]|nr:class I SAM-dependent methyltransferase [Cyclobacteriaceae bacterium]